MPFAKFATILALNHWAMDENRTLPLESIKKASMLGSRTDPLFASHDMGDAHQVVIHHRGEVIGRHAVGFDQNRIVDSIGIPFQPAPNVVVYDDGCVARDALPDHERLAFRHRLLDLRR